jgi:hypothetical protein
MPSRSPFRPRAPARLGETAGVPPGFAARTVLRPYAVSGARDRILKVESSLRADLTRPEEAVGHDLQLPACAARIRGHRPSSHARTGGL